MTTRGPSQVGDQLLNNLRGCCALKSHGDQAETCEQTRRIEEFCTICEAASRLEQVTEALADIVKTYGPSTEYDPAGPVVLLWLNAERALRRVGR